jgi:preprotein translocase subunit YajC
VDILFLILPLALLYIFLIVPQQRKQRAHRDLLRALSAGDEIMTTAGLYGTIRQLDDENLWLEVAPGVELRFARGAVARKITAAPADDEFEEYEEYDELEEVEEAEVVDDVEEPDDEPSTETSVNRDDRPGDKV